MILSDEKLSLGSRSSEETVQRNSKRKIEDNGNECEPPRKSVHIDPEYLNLIKTLVAQNQERVYNFWLQQVITLCKFYQFLNRPPKRHWSKR